MLVLDVDYKTFCIMKQVDASFFWTETRNSFVMIKPFANMVARCVIKKTTPEKVEAFKVSELYTNLAKFVYEITIDGERHVSQAIAPLPPSGEIPVNK